jgi:hypothetical protein
MMQRDGPERRDAGELNTYEATTIIGEKKSEMKKKKIPLPDAECPFSF